MLQKQPGELDALEPCIILGRSVHREDNLATCWVIQMQVIDHGVCRTAPFIKAFRGGGHGNGAPGEARREPEGPFKEYFVRKKRVRT